MVQGMSRHQAAVAALDLRGSEHVLDIGCGHGVAVRLVLERLTSGTITALDRSAKMIDQVRASIQDARVLFCASALEHADFGIKRFDAIVAVNLDFELRLPGRWALMLKGLLQPDGRLVLVLEPPPGSGKGKLFADQSLRLLAEAGFAAVQLPAPGEMALIRAEPQGKGARQPLS
jgi:cyclopropane fatty-acyl-phospholipid synthase-like methyltransferase